jgi:uncharacterized tellurite resistance protein B-like protein
MLNKHLKHLNIMKNEYNVQENKLKEMILQNKTNIRESENYTKQMLDILLQKDIEEHSTNLSSGLLTTKYLNTLVFKNRDYEEEYDINERKIIDELMEVVEVAEDQKVSGKELKDVLKNKFGWTDKRFNELKGKILQPDIWEAKSKDVKHLKFRNLISQE